MHSSASETSIPFPGARTGNHWVAVIVNASETKIFYYDSFRNPPPPVLVNVLVWWLKFHRKETFEVEILEGEAQSDGHSCGVYATQRILRYFVPETECITPESLDLIRLRTFLEIASSALQAARPQLCAVC